MGPGMALGLREVTCLHGRRRRRRCPSGGAASLVCRTRGWRHASGRSPGLHSGWCAHGAEWSRRGLVRVVGEGRGSRGHPSCSLEAEEACGQNVLALRWLPFPEVAVIPSLPFTDDILSLHQVSALPQTLGFKSQRPPPPHFLWRCNPSLAHWALGRGEERGLELEEREGRSEDSRYNPPHSKSCNPGSLPAF